MTARARIAPTTAAGGFAGGFLGMGRGDWAGMKVHTGAAWVFSQRDAGSLGQQLLSRVWVNAPFGSSRAKIAGVCQPNCAESRTKVQFWVDVQKYWFFPSQETVIEGAVMGYLAFANFKPTNGSVSFRHFDQLSSIAWRARNLLEKRTDEQVESMVSVIDDMIEDYFRTAKDEEIERLKSEGKYEYLEGDEDGNYLDIKSDAESELDYPTAENTREIDALEMIVGTWSNIFGDEAPEPLDHEYFAALALAKIGEIINSLEYTYDYKTRKFEKRDPKNSVESYIYRRAAEKAIEAMEAVVIAENKRETDRLESRYRKLLDEAKAHASAALRQHIDEQVQAAIEDFKERQKEEARNNGRLAHKDLESHKALVLEDWEKDPSAHRSADRAAVFYVDWLKEVHGVQKDYQPRTVSKWIREHARVKGIRLR